MLISSALAQTADVAAIPAGTPSASGMIFQMILLFAVLWFLLIRPQQKRLKKHEAELKAIIKGTQVVVAGLVGRVAAIQDEDTLLVDFGQNVQIPVLRAYVSKVVFETPVVSDKERKK